MKTCPKCTTQKPLTSEHWYRNRSTPDGFANQCKPCANIYTIPHARDAALMTKYGITRAQHSEMRLLQNNMCAICGCQLGAGRQVHTDHDHDTGKVRALLCHGCNVGIGMIKTPAALRLAAAYLESHHAQR